MRQSKILIAGGGIGGLATAIALLQRDFDVDVYEQAGEFREVGAGIQISPNGNRALDSLGVFRRLQTLSCDADEKEIRLWNTGRTWKLFSNREEVLRQYGYPYMTVFRPDLLRVLAEEVERLKPGAVHLGKRCSDVTQDSGGVQLHLTDGQTRHGDLLVGADGAHSRIRAALYGANDVQFSGMIAWRALLPMAQLPSHLERNVAVNWVGPGGHVVHYPIQNGRLMNLVATREGNTWNLPQWHGPSSPAACASAFEGWHPDVQGLIHSADAMTQWALCRREFLPRWSQGRVTLLGDACHLTFPFLAQGAVASIEDGVVLARCLEHYPEPTAALARYEALRRPHTYRMVRGATENGERIHAPLLADPAQAEAFGEAEWSSGAIGDRYAWLYRYDVEKVEI